MSLRPVRPASLVPEPAGLGESAFEHSPVGLLLVDVAGRLRRLNAAARRLIAGPDALQGRDLASLFAGPAPDIEALYAGHGSLRSCDATLALPDQAPRRVRLSAGAFFGHVSDRLVCVVVAETAGEHPQAETLRLAQAALRNTAEAVMVLDESGRIQSVNPAYTEITGYDPAEAIGRQPILSETHDETDLLFRLGDELRADGHWQGEIWSRRRDGGRYPALIKASFVSSPHGGAHYYVVAFRDVSSHKAYEDRIAYLAYYDALTGLANRALVHKIAAAALARSGGDAGHVAVLLLDLDGFQTVNDSLGHTAGDELLRQVGRRLAHTVCEDDTVGRQGGDVFVVIAPGLARAADAAVVVDMIMRALRWPFVIDGHTVFTTASIGVSCHPDDGPSLETLLRNANTAMHRSKAAGHNDYQYYVADMNADAHRVLQIRNNLHRALERDEFRLHYQPFVDLTTGRITGMEALIRWHNAALGTVSPAEFIPIAEENGLILPIGDWVLCEACRELARLHAAGHADLRMAVNLSARQFRQPQLADDIAAVLAESGIDGRFLEVEITETMLMAHTRATVETLAALAGMDVTVALDDFGTGYSSLGYLKGFPIGHLKIDKRFVDGIPGDEGDIAITRTIIAMAESLGIRVTAEGVETQAQTRQLRDWRCAQAQGYLFSVPLAPHDLDRLLKRYPVLPVAAGAKDTISKA